MYFLVHSYAQSNNIIARYFILLSPCVYRFFLQCSSESKIGYQRQLPLSFSALFELFQYTGTYRRLLLLPFYIHTLSIAHRFRFSECLHIQFSHTHVHVCTHTLERAHICLPTNILPGLLKTENLFIFYVGSTLTSLDIFLKASVFGDIANSLLYMLSQQTQDTALNSPFVFPQFITRCLETNTFHPYIVREHCKKKFRGNFSFFTGLQPPVIHFKFCS